MIRLLIRYIVWMLFDHLPMVTGLGLLAPLFVFISMFALIVGFCGSLVPESVKRRQGHAGVFPNSIADPVVRKVCLALLAIGLGLGGYLYVSSQRYSVAAKKVLPILEVLDGSGKYSYKLEFGHLKVMDLHGPYGIAEVANVPSYEIDLEDLDGFAIDVMVEATSDPYDDAAVAQARWNYQRILAESRGETPPPEPTVAVAATAPVPTPVPEGTLLASEARPETRLAEAQALLDQARVHWQAGEMEKCLECTRQAGRIRREALGDGHPQVEEVKRMMTTIQQSMSAGAAPP